MTPFKGVYIKLLSVTASREIELNGGTLSALYDSVKASRFSCFGQKSLTLPRRGVIWGSCLRLFTTAAKPTRRVL
jgi:hypothetical protein